MDTVLSSDNTEERGQIPCSQQENERLIEEKNLFYIV